MKRWNDSNATHKLSGGPLTANDKFNNMTYLQVPTASTRAEVAPERAGIQNRISDQSFNGKNYSRCNSITISPH